ncbi:MAG: J domain-containing protein, partial [Chloroflexaceae bacterium]|nr:J domain-containing protein [Chloroflexaceae bacterium]
VEITLEEAFCGTQRSLRISQGSASKTIRVKIPAGADNGTKIRIAGQGRSGEWNGKHGDLLITVQVRPHKQFIREHDDLTIRLPTDVYTLLLGGEIHIPMLDGKNLSLNVPANTAHGKTFRLMEQGMPRIHNPQARGHLYVTVEALLPTQLSPEERQLFEKLRSMRS